MRPYWWFFVILLSLPLFAQGSGKVEIVNVYVNTLAGHPNDSAITIKFSDYSTPVTIGFLKYMYYGQKRAKVVHCRLNRDIGLVEDSDEQKIAAASDVRLAKVDTTYQTVVLPPVVVPRKKDQESSPWEAAYVPCTTATPPPQGYEPPVMSAATPVEEASLPLYGVTAGGIYFVAKDLVTAVEGSVPRVLFETRWQRYPMVASGKYYIFRSGRRIILPLASYCFDIGGNEYLPHVLYKGRGGAFASQINNADIKDNKNFGYNFMTVPIKTDEIK
jgi:hypothetical protein